MTGVGKGGLVAAAAGSVAAFCFVDSFVACLARYPMPILGHVQEALNELPTFLTAGGLTHLFEPAALAAGLVAACGVWMAWAYQLSHKGNYRPGIEHGSARWGTPKEGLRLANPDKADSNILLTEHYGLSLPTTKRTSKLNRNIMVVGGSGSGKTSGYVLPNLMQQNSSYFVTDPKGTLPAQTGQMLIDAGYSVRFFNLVDIANSMRYNPLALVKDELDIMRFVRCLIANTKGEPNTTGDPFWDDAERLLYTALIAYLMFHCPPADRNLSGLVTLLGLAEAREDDEDFLSPLDMLFRELETGQRFVADPALAPVAFDASSRAFAMDDSGGYRWVQTAEPTRPEDDFALRSYKSFKVAAGKTMKSILISCNVRVAPITIPAVRDLLVDDEMHLDTLGDPDQKGVVFAMPSDTDSTFNFLFAIMMWQVTDVLCTRALKRYGGGLPTPVQFIFDEFATIGRIPDIDTKIAVVRSRNISITLLLQSLGQLNKFYKDEAQSIIDNCSTLLFLGGKSQDTNKQISETIGKETVKVRNGSESRGANRSSTTSYSLIERDLMQPSEVGLLDQGQALLMVAGFYPFKDGKYDVAAHKRAKCIYNPHAEGGLSGQFDVVACRNELRRESAR